MIHGGAADITRKDQDTKVVLPRNLPGEFFNFHCYMYKHLITGREIINSFEAGYADLIYRGAVADDPSASVQKVNSFFKLEPSVDGGNIEGIRLIRKELLNRAKEKKHISSLMIVAPHTHWHDRKPIIYHYDTEKEQYFIGPHIIDPLKEYLPVSFAMTSKGVLAYEWIDESIRPDIEEWNYAIELLYNSAPLIQMNEWPLGLAIDFRFKKSLFETAYSSVEYPESEKSSFSIITTHTAYSAAGRDLNIEQVAWHPYDDAYYEFTADEEAVLKELRDTMKQLSTNDEREAYLNSFGKE